MIGHSVGQVHQPAVSVHRVRQRAALAQVGRNAGASYALLVIDVKEVGSLAIENAGLFAMSHFINMKEAKSVVGKDRKRRILAKKVFKSNGDNVLDGYLYGNLLA